MQISSVRVEGAHQTRNSFLHWLIKPHQDQFTNLDAKEYRLDSVLRTARGLTHSLLETGVFTSVEPVIEKARDPLANLEDVDIVLKTRQRGRFFLKTATELGDQEGSVVCDCVILLGFLYLRSTSERSSSYPKRFWRSRGVTGVTLLRSQDSPCWSFLSDCTLDARPQDEWRNLSVRL